MESPGIDHTQNPKRHWHGPMKIKTLIQQGPCFGLEIKGAETGNGIGGLKFSAVDCFVAEKKLGNEESEFTANDPDTQRSLTTGNNHQSRENLKDEQQSGLHLLLSEKCIENGTKSLDCVTKSAHIKAVKESKQEIAEWDVEKVLEEQETHDFYCPKCKSCITKRIILRKRKRGIQNIQSDLKHEKIDETVVQFGSDDIPVLSTDDQGQNIIEPGLDSSLHALETNDQDHDTGPDIFRCLSCFSLFIPTVSGLFRIFGGRGGENVRSPLQIPDGNRAGEGENMHNSSQIPTRNQPGSYVLQDNHEAELVNTNTGKQEDNAKWEPLKAERDVPISSEHEDFLPQDRRADIGKDLGGSPKNSGAGNDVFQDNHEADLVNSDTGKLEDNSKWEPLHAEKDVPISSEHDGLLPQDRGADVGKDLEGSPKNSGVVNDVILLVKEEPDRPGTSQSVGNISFSPAPGILTGDVTESRAGEQKVDEARRFREWDILKSIVYGGLIESITSLGVVSSAAGGDATTVNIVALGLANLVGGLFMIAHGLKELKNEQHGGAADQNEKADRYQEVLGQKMNFRLHATVAVLSYLVFGLLPPVIYGFSFRKSDNKEYKLIAVAAASLLCIVLLAIGKAYVRKPPKSYIRTILYFFSIGLMASGLSYAIGELTTKLLEKLGLFEPSSAVPAPTSLFLKTVSKNPAWTSH